MIKTITKLSGKAIVYILATILAVVLPTRGAAQAWNMVNGDTIFIDACDYDGGTIYDNGGPDGNYSNGFDGWVVIQASSGVDITISGDYNIESPTWDYIYVYDGNTSGTVLVDRVGYSGSINVTASSGRLTLYFHTDGSVNYPGFALNWSAGGYAGICNSNITLFEASNVTATSATLTWTAGGSETLMLDYGHGAQAVTGNSLTLTGLNPNTLYVARLYAASDVSSRCCVKTLSFRTGCGLMTAPLVEMFDDLTVGEMPPCWSQGKNFDTEELFPMVTNTAGKSGSQSLLLSSGGNTTANHFGMVMGPNMSVDMSTMKMKVSLRSNYSNAKVEVGVCDSVSNLYNYYGFTPVDTLTISSANTWYDYEVDFSSYNGDGCRVAFRMRQGMEPSANCIVYIDDIIVENCGVENLATSHIGIDKMTLSWELIGEPSVDLIVTAVHGSPSSIQNLATNTIDGNLTNTNYVQEHLVYPNGPTGTQVVMQGVTSPVTFHTMDENGEYEFTLQPSCNGIYGESKSVTASLLTNRLGNLAQCENFEGGFPLEWLKTEQYSGNPTMASNGGSQTVRLYSYYDNETSIAIPPSTDFNLDIVTVRFRMKTDVAGCGVTLKITEDPYDDFDLHPADDTVVSSTSDWKYYTVQLALGETNFLRIRTYTPTSNNCYIYLDDITIGHCLLTGLEAKNVTNNSVTLEWDNTTLEQTDSVVIEYGATGFTAGNGTRIALLGGDVSDGRVSYTVTGLDSATTYEFIAYRSCGDNVCNPERVTATTLQQYYTVPFCENFDNVTGNDYVYLPDWARPAMYDNRPCLWQYGESAPSPTRVLDMHSRGPLWNGYAHSTAVLPYLNYEGTLSDLVVNFYGQFNSDCCVSYLEIGVLTDPNDEGTFTVVQTVNLPRRRFGHFAVPLRGYSGSDGYIGLRYYHSSNGDYYTIGIDNIEVRTNGIGTAEIHSLRSDGGLLEFDTIGEVSNITLRLISDDTVTITNVSSPYYISDLQPGTTYRYELDYGQCYPVGGVFTTTGEVMSSDWCYNFETTYNGSRFDGLYYPVVRNIYNTEAYQGSHAAYLQSYYNDRTAMVLPYLEAEDYTDLHFSFMYRGEYYNRTIVGLMHDERDTTGFFPIDTILDNDNTWREYDYDLTGLEGYGHHLVLIAYTWQSAYTTGGIFDNLRIDHGNRLTQWSHTTTATTADINWTATAATDIVQVILSLNGETVFDSIVTATEGTCHVQGLTAATTYNLQLIPISDDSGQNCTLDEKIIRTLSHDVADGFCEQFDGDWSIVPTGWNWIEHYGQQPWRADYMWSDGCYAIALRSQSPADAYTMIVMPEASVPLQGLVLGLTAWYDCRESVQASLLVVGVMDDQYDTTTFTAIDTLQLTGNKEQLAVDLSAYSGNGRYVAIKAMSLPGYDRTTYVTHIGLADQVVNHLRAYNITPTTASLRWDNMGATGALNMHISGGNTEIDSVINGNSAILTDLQAGTIYTVTIAATSDDSQIPEFPNSNIQPPTPCQQRIVKFATPAEPIAAPQCIPMDEYYPFNADGSMVNMPQGWVRPYGNAYPFLSGSYYYRDHMTLEFYSSYCNEQGDMTSMAVSPYFPEGFNGLWLDFYLLNESWLGKMVVGTMSDPYDTSTFIAHDSIGFAYGWRHISLPLSGYNGNYLAFKYATTSTCSNGSCYINGISIMHCPMPETWLSHQEDTSVWVHWSGNTPVWVEYQVGGDFQVGTGQKVLAQESPAIFNGLASATFYTFHVWPQCGDDTTFRCNYQTMYLTTMFPPVSAPYCFNFESYGEWDYPEEWSRWNPDGTVCAVTSYDGHDDSRALHLVSSYTGSVAAILPKVEPMTGCTDSLYLNFWTRRWDQTPVLVIGITDDISDTLSFTAYDTIAVADHWQHHTTALPAAALQNGRVVVRLLAGGDMVFDNLCLETCVAANVTVGDLTQHTATVTWDGHGVDTLVCEYGRAGFAQGTGYVVNITTSPYVISGLDASSDYNFIFRTICSCPEETGSVYPAGGGTRGSVWYDGHHWITYAWIDTALYPDTYGWGLGYGGGNGLWGAGGGLSMGRETQAELLSTPYCEDFDTLAVGILPAGWRRIAGSVSGFPRTNRTPVLSGARNIDLYTTTGYSNHLALPPVEDPSGLVLSFYAWCNNSELMEYSYGALTVGVMDDPDRGSTFVAIDTVTVTATNKWIQCFVDLSQYSGTGQYIAFRFTPVYSSYHIYLDNIYLGSSVVTDASVSTTTQGVLLSYSTLGNSNGVIVEWDSTGTTTLTSSPSYITGLSTDMPYDLLLRSFNDVDIQSDCHLTPIAVNPVLTLPYCENFDAVEGMYPTGWQPKHTYSTQGVDGIMEYAFRPSYSDPDVVLLPPLVGTDTIGEKYIGLTYRGHDNNSNNCSYSYLDIGYLLDTNNYTTFVMLISLHQSVVEQYHYVQLPSCSATRLAFRARSTSGWRGFSIDDLVISDTPFPTAGSVSSPNIGYSRKQLTWDASLLASHYQYEWGPAGYPQGSGTVAMSDSCSLTIEGLEPNTDYDIYFITADGQTSCTPYRFISTDAVALPYCEDFQQYNVYGWPDNWGKLPYGNYPQLYNDHGTIHLDFYNTGRQVAIMPEPYIDSIQALTVNADYWFSDSRNYMEIGILDNPSDWNTFTPVDTIRATATNCWVNATVSFANYTGTGRFIGFHYLNNYSNQYIHIDNISLQNIPQVDYQVVSSTEIAVNSGQWPKNVDYYVEIRNDGDAQGMGQTININTSPFIISGLTPGATYQLIARADSSSTTCTRAVTLTMPEMITLPYCEEFDAYGDCYNCRPQQWNYSTHDDDQNYTVSGNNWSLRFYSYYYNTHYVYAALPDLDAEHLQDVSIELNYRFENSSCMAELGVITSPDDWNSFTPVDTFLTTTDTWYTMRHDFHSYTGTGRFIAIRFKGNNYQYNYLYIDNIRLQACPLPNISLSAYNTVKCAIDSSHHTADYWVRVQSDELDTFYHVDTNPYYITGLTPETQYTFSAQCDTETESCFPSTTITTGILKSMPYCEDFNSYGSGSNCYPTGWGRSTVCGSDQIYTTSSNNYSLYFRSYYYNECNLAAVLPDLDIDSIRHLSMQMHYRFESNNCPVYIGVQTDPYDNTTFTPIDTLSTSTGVWCIDNIDFSKYEGDGRFIAIQMFGNYTYYKYLYIDYINIQSIPLVDFTLPEATTVVATTDSTLPANYWLHYTLDGSNDTTSIHVTDNTFRLEDLDANTSYWFLATPESTSESCWPWQKKTTSYLQNVPYCEEFAGYGTGSPAFIPGWSRITFNSSNDRLYIYSNSDAPDSRTLRFNMNNSQYAYAVLPELAVDNISDITLNAKVWFQGGTNISDYMLEVGVMDDMTDIGTFTTVDTLQCLVAGQWENLTATFNNYTGDGRFPAIRMISNTSYTRNIYIDRIEILSCNIPGNTSISLVGSNILQINGDTPATGYYIEYGPENFEQGTSTVEFIDVLPHDISVDYETTYDFYFKCSEDEISCVSKQTVTTLSSPIELPYCEDFDNYGNDAMPTDWLKLRLPQEYGNNCFVYNDYSHTGNKSLQFCSYYTDRHPYAILPEIDVDSLSQLAISFWMRNAHHTYHSLEIGTMSDPYDANTFIPLRQFYNSEDNVWERMQAILTGADINSNFIAFRFNAVSINSWDWLYIDDLYIDACGADKLLLTEIESESATINWTQTGEPTISIDIIATDIEGSTTTTNQTVYDYTNNAGQCTYTIGGLSPLTTYKILFHTSCDADEGYCTTGYTDSVSFFTPAGGTGCIDPTNLTAGYVTCYTGSYRDPYSSIGMVDNGADNIGSRHTIHYNPNERDPRTGNMLRTVPEGATASVRLGNWGAHKISNYDGGEAEAITYALVVDTMAFDLLIMKYAAVMQDPMHDPADQPRFRLELLNENMQLIDAECGAADFIANQNLGWNTYGEDILWKDWTTVGLDMSAYAGQTVYIRLTTYDCNEGSHYGYAYFTLGCMRKSMSAEGCGNVASNIFTAPSGFAYRWYTNQDASTYSTDQSINISSNNDITYYCNLSFIDNPSCQFTMSAFAGTRFPLSLFDSVVTIHDCMFDVSFNNHSTISMDGINPVGSGEGVETAAWNFGNGATSNNYHASTVYTEEGTYTVQLIAAIAGGECADTIEKTITLVFPPTNPRIEGPTDRCFGTEADTLILHEALSWATWSNDTIAITPTADSTYTLTVADSNGCTHTLSHSIAVHPVYDIVLTTAICDGGRYTFGDSVLTTADTYQRHLLTAIHECDSIITINLTVNPNTSSTINETINETQLPYTFNGHTFTDSVNNYSITTTNVYNCDSLITYNLEVIWNDKQTILDSTVCENHLPIDWNGIYMPDTGTYSITLQASHGEDSIVIMHVYTVPIYDDTIDYCICDNQQYTFEGTTYYGTNAGLHSHMLQTDTYGCDSLRTLRLDVRATTAGDTLADHCDQFTWYDTTYTASTNTPTHLSTNAAGCDSTTTLHLTIRYSTASTIEETIVENDLPYTFNGATFTDSADLATVTIPNAVGCDSVITYTLHVEWNTGSRIDSNVCINQLPITWNNEVFDTTVANTMMTRTVVIPSVTGSDSTITMRVHVRPIYDDTIDYSICDNQQYTFEGTTYYGTDAGLHSHMLHTDTYGCDSLRTLRLDVRATTTGDTVADHCDLFVWYDTAYTASTDTPTHLSTNAVGCDSTTTLHLTIRYSTASTIEETIVENDLPYTFNGQTFTDSTDLTIITIPNTVGCDSVISYTLHVDWNTGSRLDSNVCINYLPITWNNEVFDTTLADVTMMRTIVIPSATGSDSTIIMRVHVRPIYDDTIDYSICDNQQYTFEGTTYYGTDAGLHSHMLQTDTYGCDSLRTLRLDVRATTTGDTTADHCDQFVWYDTAYTASTETPTHLSTNAAGCDSTTTLHLTIRYSTTSTIEETIVENDLPYTFNGQTFDYIDFGDPEDEEYSEQTTATVTITNAVGCDSIISYTLNIEWNTGSRLDSNVCLNQLPITWNNEIFDTTVANTIVQHTVVIPSVTGSDSTIVMRVHVRPIYDDTIDYSICDNQQYTFEGTTYYGTDAGLHSHMLQTDTYGCDSLRTLRLDVRATTTGDTVADHCDQFVWYDTAYTASTDTPTHLSTNAAGCDSTTTLHLTIRYSTASTVYDTIVQNQLPYNYHDSILADSISHTTVVFPNAVQCDSVVDYSLFVFWNVGTALYDTVCNDSLPLVWNSVTFDTTVAQTTTVIRSAVFLSATGADSVVLMHLTVHPLYDHHTYADICDNQQYTFGDSTFLGSWSLESDQWQVVHLDSLLSQHGCDSLSTLHLSIHHTYDHHYSDTVCANQSYTWGTPQRDMYNPWSVTSYLHGNDTLQPMYTTDSLLTVTDNLTSVFSCDSVSTLHLLIKQAYDLHYRDTICSSELGGWNSEVGEWQAHTYTFMGATYDTTGTYTSTLSTTNLQPLTSDLTCDSIRTLHLKVYHTYEQHIYDTIYDGDIYIFEQTTYDTTGIYPHILQATFGCDSLRVLHLQRNRRTYLDSSICQNQMPVVWNGIQFANGGGIRQGRIQIIKDSLHLSGLGGIDSLVVMTVTVRDTSATTDLIHACDSLLWIDNVMYRQNNHISTVTVPNSLACDSVIHLALTVNYTHHYNDYIDACDSLQWIDGHWYYADTAGFAGEVGSHYTFGPVDTLSTTGGCDSVVVLDLHMHYADYYETIDTFCYYQTYNWRNFSIHSSSTYLTEDYYLTDTIRTKWNCDSVLAIRLTKMARPKMHFIIDPLCSQYSYSVTASITLDHGQSEPTPPYVNWSTYPFDTSIDGFENDTTVIVNPLQNTTYYAYADYHETPLCPINDSLRLRPVVIPSAEMRITPEALSYSQLHFKAFDLSTPKPYSMSPDSTNVWHTDWMVDWEVMDENNIVFDYTVPRADVDSVIVALRAYNGVCYDTAIHVMPMLFVSIFSPNAFTPYQETNNRFVIFTDGVLETELYIYNREGMLIYYTKDIEQGWDGHSLKGIDCPEGNYVWKLKYRSIDHPDRWQSKVGSILLLK